RTGERPAAAEDVQLAVGDLGGVAQQHRDLHRHPRACRRLPAVSLGETLYHASAMRPFSSTRNAERTMPKYFLPYMLFSPHVPYASATAWSSSASSRNPSPYFSSKRA